MTARTSLLGLILALVVGSGVGHDVFGQPASPQQSTAVTAASGDASVRMGMTLVGATPDQVARIEEAVQRFRRAGLELPDLTISFHDSVESCGGARGAFWSLSKGVSFCSDEVDVVYEHELAHAWAAANLTDHQRSEFMHRNELTVWSAHDVPWNERATERVAVIIQQGVSGLPIPPTINEKILHSVREFERLTGMRDPRLIEWAWQHADGRALAEIPGEAQSRIPAWWA